MALDYTTDALIASIRSRCYENVGGLSDAKVLRIMNEETISYLVPFLEAARTDLFTTHTDTPILAGVAGYYVPSASLGNRIRDICLIDSSGTVVRSLYELDLDSIVQGNPYFNLLSSGYPTGYYFEGEQIKLYPIPNVTDGSSFRLYYSRRPSELILKAGAAQITAFPGGAPGGSYRVTVASSSAFTNGQAIDLVSNSPAFSVPQSTVVTNIPDATHIDITGTQPTSLAVGDWVCPAGQAPVLTGVPGEHVTGLLVQWMVCRLMAARGDDAAYKRAAADTMKAELRAKLLLRQRNKGDVHQLQSQPYRFKGGLGGLRRG